MRFKALAVFSALVLSATALHAQAGTTTKPIDINTATRTQLADAGWGQYADAIIAARPYKSMNDLVEKKVVPPTAYEKGVNQFTIGTGDTPLSDPNKSSTVNPPTVTPPTVTPGTTSPTTTTTPPTVQPPTANPGATSPTTTTAPPTVTPGTTPPTAAPGAATTPASPTK